jgi:Ca2+-binding RTX toxin-like protein
VRGNARQEGRLTGNGRSPKVGASQTRGKAMATFYANVQVNLTGKGGGAIPVNVVLSPNVIDIQYSNAREYVTGNFTYYNSSNPVQGQVYSDVIYDYSNNILTSWTADGGIYDAATMFKYIRNGQAQKLFEYAFSLNDSINGSEFNDKLDGYAGNDYIDGWLGNDKLWGGSGYDDFFFAADDGRDKIMDFNRKFDTLILDASLARNFGDVRRAAETYKKGVILNFGSDEQIKIAGLKIKQLKKVDFDFVDIDV